MNNIQCQADCFSKWKSRISLYFLFLTFCELLQAYVNHENRFIYGDFYITSEDQAALGFALILALLTTFLGYFIVSKFSSKAKPRFSLKLSYPVITIFLVNLFIVLITNIGVVKGEIQFGFLFIFVALIPIGYLITVCFLGDQKNIRLLMVSLIYIGIGLYQTFLGPILHVLYLSFIRANKKRWFFLSIIVPILVLSPILIKYKFESRDQTNENLDDLLVISTIITGRLTTVSTFQFALEQPKALAKFCSTSDYNSVFVAAIAPIIPREIIGIKKLKTFNNCLIEYRLRHEVEDYSVNSPWFLNAYLLWLESVGMMFVYIIFTVALMASLMGMSNYLFGYNSIIFSSVTIPSFLVSGNVAYLVVPLYFLILLFIYNTFKKDPFFNWKN